jgi:hypothetical protein
MLKGKLSNGRRLKALGFRFLDAEDCTRALINFCSDCITFVHRVQPSDIPVSFGVTIHGYSFCRSDLHPSDPRYWGVSKLSEPTIILNPYSRNEAVNTDSVVPRLGIDTLSIPIKFTTIVEF